MVDRKKSFEEVRETDVKTFQEKEKIENLKMLDINDKLHTMTGFIPKTHMTTHTHTLFFVFHICPAAVKRDLLTS